MPCPNDRIADLHTHTTASDGDQSPTELIRQAHEVGIKAIAVTDHDTTRGVREACEAGNRYGVEVLAGIELSAEISQGQCHILGLLIDPESVTLLTRLREVLDNRALRNDRIVAKLNALGMPITIEEVRAEAGGEVTARPHFARVLVDSGYVATMQEAFDVYLAKGAKAYVDRDRLTQAEAVNLIHAAGGVAILAHPNNLKRDAADTETVIRNLQSVGLDGIEAFYNRHTAEENARYAALADRLGLLATGGSDFHGPSVKPTVFLGHVEGECPAPYSLVERLKERKKEY